MIAISAGSTVLLQTPGSSKGSATFMYRLTNADRSVRALGTLGEGARRLNELLKASSKVIQLNPILGSTALKVPDYEGKASAVGLSTALLKPRGRKVTLVPRPTSGVAEIISKLFNCERPSWRVGGFS